MGKATRTRAPRSQLPRAVRAADIPAAQLAHGTFEEAAVPNPHGEVEVAGTLRQHLAAKRVPPILTLHRRKVIDRATLAVLEWYADRLALAQAGIFKSGLGSAGGAGGGCATSHIPVTEAMIQAAGDVAWARRVIGAGARLTAFDAVLVGEETFAESARREAAARYVRKSVSRRQRELRDLFMAATRDLTRAHAERFGARAGRVQVGRWSDPDAEAAWRAIEQERIGE